ncbi:hypothetical protein SAMN03159341_11511 [Paenibacillus sp. 1_12]|nr:hypothetical protein SAMN03159341_11511 [Paenibacillus sp. 1_12]
MKLGNLQWGRTNVDRNLCLGYLFFLDFEVILFCSLSFYVLFRFSQNHSQSSLQFANRRNPPINSFEKEILNYFEL